MRHWSRSNAFVRVGDRLIISQWLGVIVLAVTLLAVSLLAPLSLPIGVLVASVLCSLALMSPSARLELLGQFQQLKGVILLGYSAVVLSLAALLTRPVTWLDTGLYHYSAIQWLAQYGSVTGVALIFNNLGFVSAWFALSAPLNPAILGARGAAVLGGFVLLLAVLHWLVCLLQWIDNCGQASDRFGLIFLSLLLPIVLLFRLFTQILVSPSPDMPVAFLIGIVPWAILVIDNAEIKPEPPRRRTNHAAIIPLILSVGAMTIKLTTFPLLVIGSLYYLTRNFRSGRQLGVGGVVAGLLLAPMLLAGIKMSGCPLYPSSVLCFDLPWLPSLEKITEVERGTHGWTTWFGSPPDNENPWLWLLRSWLQSERSNLGIVLLSLLSATAIVVSLKPLLESSVRGKYWVLATGTLGFSFLMATAPFLRFALPYLLVLPSLVLLIWYERIFPRAALSGDESGVALQYFFVPPSVSSSYLSRLLGIPHQIIVSIALAVIAVVLTIFLQRNPIAHVFLPPPMRTTAFVTKQVNDITYFSPEVTGEVCWDIPLPCGFIIDPDVRLRNPDRGVSSGFVRDQTIRVEDY
ncbi:LIC_10190 family membrane protein [Thermocoleostomius sinensis]|uniref:DUF8201 domain-containing protein n=1 Tax=Thermocoleostomius sinensis A174 TaxID=2016057 RepID=A0A9E8ZD85_9CYAN|nr:hypothetical protein [Thermocoleostomius sinensis]WAL61149.1 hypothetical protein OXH18_03870 [Thermocoleostomius sinensis A174]